MDTILLRSTLDSNYYYIWLMVGVLGYLKYQQDMASCRGKGSVLSQCYDLSNRHEGIESSSSIH